MAALIGLLVELGYGVGYRVLDARYFGVPQRRRRVFIVALSPGGRAGAERAAEVLSVGSRCDRHPPTGQQAREEPAGGPREGAVGPLTIGGHVGIQPNGQDAYSGQLITDELSPAVLAKGSRFNGPDQQGYVIGGLTSRPYDDRGVDSGGLVAASLRASDGHHGHSSPRGDGADNLVVGTEADPGGVRAPDGLAGRVDDREQLAATLNAGGNRGGFRTEPGEHLVTALTQGLVPAAPTAYGKRHNATRPEDAETWGEGDEARSLNAFDGDRTTLIAGEVGEDPLLPVGLDSNRYRCCGNGVVASVTEWIGWRLAAALGEA